MKFEWDRAKAAANAKKHKVTFEAAKTVFYDDFAVQFSTKTTLQQKTDSCFWA